MPFLFGSVLLCPWIRYVEFCQRPEFQESFLRFLPSFFTRMDRFTGSTPFRRSANPNEIAYLALYLASDESSFSSGSEFVADGGVTAT